MPLTTSGAPVMLYPCSQSTTSTPCHHISYHAIMIRTQIQLTETQARALRAQARLQERSMADLVRESVSEYLARRRIVDRGELARRALGLAGRFRSGCLDLAEDHDRYLDEAFDS